ncbi:TrbC/VirB2 family protein [Rothia sp. AR01]|uniref:TrbC/VirB2 family protein n=1 Tax=Rothia santali TaxID=2949643 RepID=A0A9X2HDH4_9MICC|nr:TrbC/VirB2 family protein [Rothia santali]MCP3425179.1 TrbC/VirB2 family protein [Rothia santali]
MAQPTTKTQTPVRKRIGTAVTGASLFAVTTWLSMVPAHAEVKPAPTEFCDAADTFTAWLKGIAGVLAIIGLIVIGITMFFAHQNETGGGPMKKIGYWGGGAALVASAASIAGIFITSSLNCA